MAAHVPKTSSTALYSIDYQGDSKDVKSSMEHGDAAAQSAIASTATAASGIKTGPISAQQIQQSDPLASTISAVASDTLNSAAAAATSQEKLCKESDISFICSKPFEEINEYDQKILRGVSQALDEKRRQHLNAAKGDTLTITLAKGMIHTKINKMGLDGVPEPTTESSRRAMNAIEKTFTSCGVFPVWLSWGFTVYRLLQKYSPSDAEEWPRILNDIAYSHHLTEVEHMRCEPMVILELGVVLLCNFEKNFSALYQRCAAKLSKKAQIQELLDLLTLWRSTIQQDQALYPNLPVINKQDGYDQILEFMEFVDKFARISPGKHSLLIQLNQIVKPKFNWKELFPKNFKKMMEQKDVLVREMNIAFGYIRYVSFGTRVESYAKSAGKGVVYFSSLGKQLPESSRIHKASQQGEICDVFHINALVLAEKVYTSLFQAMMPSLGSSNVFEETAIKTLKLKLKKVSENEFSVTPGLSSSVKQGFELINKFAEENKWDATLRKTLQALLFNIASYLKNGTAILSPYFKAAKGTDDTLIKAPFLALCPYTTFHLLQRELKNLSYTTSKLNEVKKDVLDIIKKSLQSISFPILNQHYDKILECIKELHIFASSSLLDYLEVLFASARVYNEEEFVLKSDNSIMPVNSMGRNVVDYLSLVGLERVVKSVRKSLDPSKIQEDLKSVAAAKLSLQVQGAAPFANLAVLSPSGNLSEDTAAETSKPLTRKEKRTAAKPSVSSNIATAASSAAAAPDAPTALPTSVYDISANEPFEITPTKMTELKALLERHGYSLLREGHRHSIWKAKGKDSIAIPRHMGGNGTMKTIKKQVSKK